MTVYVVYKHYWLDDRPFVLAIYATRELAEQAVRFGSDRLAPCILVGEDNGNYDLWVREHELLGA